MRMLSIFTTILRDGTRLDAELQPDYQRLKLLRGSAVAQVVIAFFFEPRDPRMASVEGAKYEVAFFRGHRRACQRPLATA